MNYMKTILIFLLPFIGLPFYAYAVLIGVHAVYDDWEWASRIKLYKLLGNKAYFIFLLKTSVYAVFSNFFWLTVAGIAGMFMFHAAEVVDTFVWLSDIIVQLLPNSNISPIDDSIPPKFMPLSANEVLPPINTPPSQTNYDWILASAFGTYLILAYLFGGR